MNDKYSRHEIIIPLAAYFGIIALAALIATLSVFYPATMLAVGYNALLFGTLGAITLTTAVVILHYGMSFLD